MATLNVTITLNNIDNRMPAEQLAGMIEGIIRENSGMDVQTSIYDTDSTDHNNPITMRDMLKKVQ